jgi:chromosomal replication initiation ATPase DnaA
MPSLRAAQADLNPEDIKQATIKKINNAKLSRKICIYLIRKHTSLTLKQIAASFRNISDAGVSVLYNRLDRKRMEDRKLNNIITEVEKLLKVET